jgi:hypothetical protein
MKERGRTSSSSEIVLCFCRELLLLASFEHETFSLFGVFDVL